MEAGRVSVGGEELTEHTVERIRKRTAYVPQELFLPAESVDDMLHLPFHLKANRGGDFSEEKLFRFWTLLGLERDLLHRKVVQLSGGQRQRIILSMAAGFSVTVPTRLRSVPNTKPAGNRLPHVFSHMTST